MPWAVAEPGEGSSLRIGYESDPCTRAREARVEETDDRVVVELFDPERDPKKACIQIAKPGCVVVRLEQPLRHRRVVGGEGPRRPIARFGPCRPIPSR